MTVPRSLLRPSAIHARLSARLRAEARVIARLCEGARRAGHDRTEASARALELVEAYVVALEGWCLGERTTQALVASHLAYEALSDGASSLRAAATILHLHRNHLCKFPTHAPEWWLPTGQDLERALAEALVWVWGAGDGRAVVDLCDQARREVEREDVERASAAKTPLWRGAADAPLEHPKEDRP